MKAIYTGWREYPDPELAHRSLLLLYTIARQPREPQIVVHGDGRGLDQMVKKSMVHIQAMAEAVDAVARQIPVPARWALFGVRAGLLRNEQMWTEHYADTDLCVGVPGPTGISTGTPHCMNLARLHDCPLWEFPWGAGWVDPPPFRLSPPPPPRT